MQSNVHHLLALCQLQHPLLLIPLLLLQIRLLLLFCLLLFRGSPCLLRRTRRIRGRQPRIRGRPLSTQALSLPFHRLQVLRQALQRLPRLRHLPHYFHPTALLHDVAQQERGALLPNGGTVIIGTI